MDNGITRNKSALPVNYDPEKALKIIASAEAAENYYRRAKDPERLYEAIEAKLTEQRNFVIWWDGQEHDKGGGNPYQDKNSRRRSATTVIAGEAGLPERYVIERWRRRLKDVNQFDKSLQATQERCRRACEAEKGSTEQKGASGTGENEWYTPIEYIKRVRIVLGEIDLDPASSEIAQMMIQAKRFFSIADDGLAQPWFGRIWLNPPYAQPFIAEFVTKLVKEFSLGNTEAAILLTHNYTDTSWFHEAAGMCDAICFTRGRVKFISSTGEIAAPTQGQAFFYFGDKSELFEKEFRDIGFIVSPMVNSHE